MVTPEADIGLLAPGARVEIRDADWLITKVTGTDHDGMEVRATGLSELVRDQPGIFYTSLDHIRPLRPEETVLVPDPSPAFRRSRLFLESLLRRTPLPITESRPAIGHRQLLADLEYQKQAVAKALNQPRPRLLIADAVGLGKTLEIGMILSELIRRGRGERIMVVTPRAVLEQFQRELWTRFSIPLTRLDSEGIQRVRRKIPASRNPFTYYKRVIVSIDTLKSRGRYGHHLEDLTWDAVVIDECHSVTNPQTGRSQLARMLAPRTDALILASATPHNGKRSSFAELINLLDPTAIANPDEYGNDEIKDLYIRRFKKDIAAEVSGKFPDRADPMPIAVSANPEEEAVIENLETVWLYPDKDTMSPASGQGKRLFPWTLLKSFLSSAPALEQTLAERLRNLESKIENGDQEALLEVAALEELRFLNRAAHEAGSSKLDRLVTELKEIGIQPGSSARVVIFSERIATLKWLAAELPERLDLPGKAFRSLHGGLQDKEQMAVVEEFGLGASDVRVLLSGDVASEGVNLHRECHHLIHFDLPWSVIRIDQRNGRIDRYGQTSRPEIRTMILTPENERISGDIRILTRLIDKENEIKKTLGEVAAFMGFYDADAEEEEIKRRLASGAGPEEVVPDQPAASFDLLDILGQNAEPAQTAVETAPLPTLFTDDAAFVDEAIASVFDDPVRKLELRREDGTLSLKPPPDLKRRFQDLPQTYIRERKVTDRLTLTTDPVIAERSLERARNEEDMSWPEVGWLGSQHPVIEWLLDKVLAQIGRGEAPVLTGAVEGPVLLTQAMYSNTAGQPTVVEWLGISGLDSGQPNVRDLLEVLDEAGVGSGSINRESASGMEAAQKLVPAAAAVAREHIESTRSKAEEHLNRLLDEARKRASDWEQLRLDLVRIEKEKESARQIRSETEQLIDRLRSSGEPLIRVVGAILPEAG